MNRLSVRLLSPLLALAVLAAAGDGLLAQERSSGGRAQVLVASFGTTDGIDSDFGQEIAERVRERVRTFQFLTAVSGDRIEDTMDRFELDEDRMDLVSWRQLSGRLNAQLLIWGEISRSSDQNGNVVDAVFIDTNRGEETPVPPITVSGDDDDAAERAASHIAQTLDRHVQFLRSVLNCQDYLSASQYGDAARNCDEALEINPSSGRALYLRGQVAQEQEAWEAARGYFSKVVAQDSADENALQSLAYVHAQLGNNDMATRLYREYLQFNPDDQDVRLSVAYNLAGADAYEQAMQIVRDGISRDSSAAQLWKYLGDLAIQKGTAGGSAQIRGGGGATVTDTAAIETALEAYDRYIGLQDSVQVGLYKNVVAAHRQLGQTEEAEATLADALERFPGDPSLWSLRADVLARTGDLEGAVASMDSVVARDSTYRNAYFKRGVLALRAGQDDRALEDFQRAVDRGRDPNQIANAIFGRAYQNHFKNSRYEQALAMFETALEFAEAGNVSRQISFFAGYAHYQIGQRIDGRNKEKQSCALARQAKRQFQQVPPYMEQAGDYQAQNQQSVLQGVDTFIFRQDQILKKQNCQ